MSYPTLRPTLSPLNSGRNTPLSAQGSGGIGSRPPTQKPAQDSFGSLLSFTGTKKTGTANLSLKEQQERLAADKRRQEEEKRKQAQAHYGDGQFWDTLGSTPAQGSRTASPAVPPPSSAPIASKFPVGNGSSTGADDDLFAAFNANTKVDNASHYPPPPLSARTTPANGTPSLNLSSPSAWAQPSTNTTAPFGDDDDDPFGLNELKPSARAPPPTQHTQSIDDDDFLGDLAKPVEEVRKNKPVPTTARRATSELEPGKAIEDSSSSSEDEAPSTGNDPFDKAVAELVGYGFSLENARRGLTESGAGLNVQAAVNWLLDDAHRQAKEKARGGSGPGRQEEERGSSRSRNGASQREQGLPNGPSRRDNRSPAALGAEADFTKTAAAVGANLFKTANSLWKTGQKKVQKAVAEYQQEGDPNQPKWMRDAQLDRAAAERAERSARQAQEVTDEAMMLESGQRPSRKQTRPPADQADGRSTSNGSSRNQSPAITGAPQASSQNSAVPKWQQQPQNPSRLDPRARVSKQAVEEESAQMYVSPARRKKTTPQPTAPETSQPEADLFNTSAPPKTASSLPQRSAQSSPALPQQQPPRAQRPSPPVAKPRPAREVPALSPVALQTSTKHRLDGTAHFKRGDYAAAHASYSTSLQAIPPTHPLAILLLCNRALTAIKTGEPRQAVADADQALALIGTGKGEGESVELGGAQNEKRDMKELYGKALTRKAEALEQMEKWADAGAVWQLCVESGVGGPTAIAGRQRCQKALAPKPVAKPRPTPAAAAARPRPAAATKQQDSARVEQLRAANKAAEKEDAEKFALTDKVDARVAAWRDGKRDNIRALLGSLDTVLWENSGWKKVGLHELVMANKVKINYMKAIAKTHPDKVSLLTIL